MSIDISFRMLSYLFLIANLCVGHLSATPLTLYQSQIIPACARSCFQSFVSENFPSSACASSDYCTCTSDSASGFSLGEGALSCLISYCDGWTESDAEEAYDLCTPYPNAVPNTHSVLTITQTFTALITNQYSTPASATTSTTLSTTSVPYTTRNVVASSHSATTPLASLPSISSSTRSTISTKASSSTFLSSTILPSSVATTTSPSLVSPVPAISSSAAAAAPTAVLTKPQIAGVVVAAIGAAALGFGLCFLLLLWRRKKAMRRLSVSTFGGGKDPDTEDTTPDMAVIARRDFGSGDQESGRFAPRPALALETRNNDRSDGWAQWKQANRSGLEIPSRSLEAPRSAVSQTSPITPASYKTTSQLLPDKPSYSPFPAPLRPNPQSKRASRSIEALGAVRNNPASSGASNNTGPRFPGSLDTSQAHMQQEPVSRRPSVPPHIYTQFQSNRPRSPPQTYKEPRGDTYLPYRPPARSILRKPLAPQEAPYNQDPGLQAPPRALNVDTQQMSRPPIPLPPQPFELTPTPSRKSSRPRRKKSDPRPETYFSTGSETSFEDADQYSEFAEPVSALTPVKETSIPSRSSPITYPAIPTSAAESPSNKIRISTPAAHSNVSLIKLRAEENDEPKTPKGTTRNSAKYKILVQPGLTPLDIPTTPTSLRSPHTPKISSNAPWRDH